MPRIDVLRGLGIAAAAVVAAWLACAPAVAEDAKPLRGVALVIGNSEYEHLSQLVNPAGDAEAIEDLLDKLGFEVDRVTDADQRRLKRDLERFVEDAGDADVAMLYYAGHGIEAGGENFLVPVDADLAALDDASDRLVPISGLLDQLRKTAPVTIVMLDACRNSPFPADAKLKLTGGAEPVALSASGLAGATRGATTIVGDTADGGENVGSVVAFAAEPGKAALDGEPGGHSPYAAAILRHFSAMTGMEFGIVMRMVGNEVYLKTNARQRPWVNESLTRLLYFGNAPDPLPGEAGEILRERQGLLVRIDALPDVERRLIETAALDGGVPMDALYGMLNVLGTDAPKDPEQLDAVLRTQTARLKQILAEREALKSTDPEIVRLSALADQAIEDGALGAALRLHEQAKARVKQMQAGLEQTASDLSARFAEAADVYARSAATYEIAYDYRKAAADYGEAFRLIERWDDQLAWKYKNAQAFALNRSGESSADPAAIEQAVAAAREALAIVTPDKDPKAWAASQDNLGYALRMLGMRLSDPAVLRDSVAALEAALVVQSRERDPLGWARAQADLALALRDLAVIENDMERMQQAITASRLSLEELTRERGAFEWAMAESNLGNTLTALARRVPNFAQVNAEAIDAYRSALEEITANHAPLAWAMVQNNLADALYDRARRGADMTAMREAEAAFRAVLAAQPRDSQSRQWAKAQAGLGNTLSQIGTLGEGTSELTEAVAAYRAALEVYTRESDQRSWTSVQHNLGIALAHLGEREKGTASLEQAATALRLAADEYARRQAWQSVITVNYTLGGALALWGERETGSSHLEAAVIAFHAALEKIQTTGWRPYFGAAQSGLGNALLALANRETGTAHIEEAILAYRAALDEYRKAGPPLQAVGATRSLGLALLELGRRKGSTAAIEEGRSALIAARDYHQSAGETQFDAYFANLIAQADAMLKTLRN